LEERGEGHGVRRFRHVFAVENTRGIRKNLKREKGKQSLNPGEEKILPLDGNLPKEAKECLR